MCARYEVSVIKPVNRKPDYNADNNPDNNDDDTQRRIHDCIGSLAFIKNETTR